VLGQLTDLKTLAGNTAAPDLEAVAEPSTEVAG
jgi:hypothetical protein